jgi:hypothetical protein
MSLSSRRGASAAAGTQSPVHTWRTWRTWRRLIPVLPVSAVLVLAACSGGAGSPVLARQVSGQQPGSPRSLTSSGWTSRTPRCPR